jgi:putative ABC transport system permease protein
MWLDGGWAEFVPHIFDGSGFMKQNIYGDTIYLPLHGELRGTDVPNEVIHMSLSNVVVIVPEVAPNFYLWAIQTADPYGFTEHARGFFDLLPTLDEVGDIGFNAQVFNRTEEEQAMRSIFHLIMTAVYAFVGMLTLIALTNVISTISTNVRSRSREFAVLQSVGMTNDGLKRMLNLESILCSAKSLVFGIPLGVGVSYLIYLAIMESVDFAYEFPWLAALQCVVAVFAITWVTMRYSASRLRGRAIVEKIRDGEVRQ